MRLHVNAKKHPSVFRLSFLSVLAVVLLPLWVSESNAQPLPSISEAVSDAIAMEGYFNLYWNESTGKLYWEIDKLDTEFLYQVSMGSALTQ
jgi:bifunctional pyridoxal-dependent enzyme with beta-cystathionase and maltose regulon repressor activities